MDKLSFQIDIAASPLEVHQQMLSDAGYRQWTSVFSPSSHYIGTWQTGHTLWFVALDEGKQCGMVSRVLDNQPGQHVYLEHIGVLEDGKEVLSGPAVDSWAGAREDYLFAPTPTGCLLTVQLDCNPDWQPYFQDTFPKALQQLKALCEQSS